MTVVGLGAWCDFVTEDEYRQQLLHVHGVEATAEELRLLPYDVVFSERLRARVVADAVGNFIARAASGGPLGSLPSVLVLVADLDVRVLTEDGELLRELTLDPSRDYQRRPKGGNDVLRQS